MSNGFVSGKTLPKATLSVRVPRCSNFELQSLPPDLKSPAAYHSLVFKSWKPFISFFSEHFSEPTCATDSDLFLPEKAKHLSCRQIKANQAFRLVNFLMKPFLLRNIFYSAALDSVGWLEVQKPHPLINFRKGPLKFKNIQKNKMPLSD